MDIIDRTLNDMEADTMLGEFSMRQAERLYKAMSYDGCPLLKADFLHIWMTSVLMVKLYERQQREDAPYVFNPN